MTGRSCGQILSTLLSLAGRQWEPRNNLSHDNHSLGQDLNAEQSKYQTGALSDSVQCSVGLMLQKCKHPAT
jgi:hypothetical protein